VRPDYNIDQPSHPFRPYGATPGHAFEWARLLLSLRAAYADGPVALSEAAEHLAATAADDAWDSRTGGFVYTTDLAGIPVVTERFHWVACEAVATCWALDAANGDSAWYDRASTYWAWIRARIVDPTAPGGWRHELDEDNVPVERTWIGRPDVYHALQAVLLPSTSITRGLALDLAERR
jgi:mannose/cellobiose epimerase-like protein (N-acyl-D-glucosamine 2-epimerase family)